MANHDKCVFCGEDLRFFHSYSIRCGDVSCPCCKDCAGELAELSEEEQCRRALRLGLVEQPEKLETQIELYEQAESHRPICTRCGEKLIFQELQCLDNSPLRDGLLNTTFDVLPACCPVCGKYEFYNPEIVRKNGPLVFLARKDIAK